jgi:LemA protein
LGLTILIVVLAAGTIAILAVAFLSVRNTLIRQRNELRQAWAALDQLLKQRRDELPRLIGTCRSYLGSPALFEPITTARAAEQRATALPEKARAASELNTALNNLLVAGDRNQALSLDASYRQLKKLIGEMGERIAVEQARFNQQARAFNGRLARGLGNLVAHAVGLKPQALFEAAAAPGK